LADCRSESLGNGSTLTHGTQDVGLSRLSTKLPPSCRHAQAAARNSSFHAAKRALISTQQMDQKTAFMNTFVSTNSQASVIYENKARRSNSSSSDEKFTTNIFLQRAAIHREPRQNYNVVFLSIHTRYHIGISRASHMYHTSIT
jgi:hypothetical protein